MAVTMKNAVFWDIKQFASNKKQITSPLEFPAG
jgi:hypothetical protein